MKNKMRLTLLLAFCMSFLCLAQVAEAEPYYSWQSEYDGTSPHSIVLYNFNEDQVYEKWSGWAAIEQVTQQNPANNKWMAQDHELSNAYFAAGGKFGWGMHNIGGTVNTDRIALYDSADIFPSGADPSLSVEFWVSFNMLNTIQFLVDKKYADSVYSGYIIYLDGNNVLNFRIGDGSQTLQANAALGWETGRAYHIAGTWDADTDTIKLYRDGEEVASATYSGSAIQNSSHSVFLGQRQGSSYGALNGMMDDFRVSDIAYEYAIPPIPPHTGPYYGWMKELDGTEPSSIALYNFNKDQIYDKWSGYSAIEQITKANPTSNKWMAHDAPASCASFDAGGKFGWGMHNVGGQSMVDYVGLDSSADMFPDANDPSISFECWVKLNDLSQSIQYITDKAYDTKCGFMMYLIRLEGSGQDEYRLYFEVGNGTEAVNVWANLQWDVGQFYHIAGTWDAQADTAYLYRDGVKVASVLSPGMSIINSSTAHAVRLGNRLGRAYWVLNGTLDDVRISDIAYEYSVYPECGQSGALLDGDISGLNDKPDCYVDFLDLDKLASQWLSNTEPTGGTPPAFFTPAPDNAAGYDPDKMYPQGRIFPFSYYSIYSPDTEMAKENGLTGIGPYYEADQSEMLSNAQALDLKCFYRVGMEDINFSNMPSDAEIEAELTSQVTAVASHQEIAWWYLLPEETNRNIANELHYLEIAADAIRAADPCGRPVWHYLDNGQDAADLAYTVVYLDVCSKGSYTNYGGHNSERIYCRWSVEQETTAIENTSSDAIPLIMPEMFEEPAPGDVHLIHDWTRHDAYLGFITGAKGFVSFSGFRRSGFPSFEDYLDGYTSVSREINGQLDLGQVLLFGEERSDITVTITSGATTATMASPPYSAASVNFLNMADTTGGRYLLMVNSANSAVGVNVSGLPSADVLRRDVFNDDDFTDTVGGSFSASFEPLEVKCFRIIPEPQNCGDEGSEYLAADIAGIAGPDCYVDLLDFALISQDWLNCIAPEDPECSFWD